jgi:hypothetical protein
MPSGRATSTIACVIWMSAARPASRLAFVGLVAESDGRE